MTPSAHSTAGDYDAAIDSCRQVLLLNPTDARAISCLDRIHAAIDDQQLTVLQQPRSDPGTADARARALAAEAAIKAKQEESRIRSAVDDARRRFVKGEQLAAIQSLEALQPTANALVAQTLEELRRTFRELEERRRLEKERAEKERVERQRRITALLSDAWAALKDRRLADAERALGLVRDIDPAVPELSDLLERVQQAQAAARRNEELERTLGEFDQLLSRGDLARAGDLLQSAASLAAPTRG